LTFPIRIFLGDLTYDTVGMSTEVFPLNIGYISAYCEKLFGSKVEITLFKYIDDLEKAIHENPPDVLGLSNYVWNHRIGLEMFDLAHSKNPNTITVWGGPNFPADIESQQTFMNNCPNVDFYVPIEGEIGFSNIVENLKQLYEDQWKKNNEINTSIKLPITISINSKKTKKIIELEQVLYSLDLVSDFSILNFNSEIIQYKITYNGTPNIFLNDMKEKNLELEMKNNMWILK